jgi:chromosome segregation ATPase
MNMHILSACILGSAHGHAAASYAALVCQDLTAKARQLQLTAAELQQLKEDHFSLQARTAALSQQLVATSGSLGETQAAQQQAAAEVLQLGSQLEQAEQEKAQLRRQVRKVLLLVVCACVNTLL